MRDRLVRSLGDLDGGAAGFASSSTAEMKSLLIVQDLHETALLRIRRDALGKRGSPFRAALIVGGRAWASIAGTFIVMRILTLLVFAMMHFFVEEFKGNIRVRIHDLCAAVLYDCQYQRVLRRRRLVPTLVPAR
jgi:hypothetical protein